MNPSVRSRGAVVGRERWLRTCLVSLLEHLPLLGFLLLSWIAYLIVSSAYRGPHLVVYWNDLYTTLVVGAAAIAGVLAAYFVIWRLRRAGAGSSEAGGWRDFFAGRVSARQILGMFVALAWWLVFVRIFDTLKAYIPVIIPFRWDELFMRVDRTLHGGVHPWQLLHQLFGGEFVTVAFDEFYYSWYFVVLLAILWAAWSASRKERLRFFVALAAVQFGLGNVMALLGSSAGPIYYGRIVENLPAGGAPFAALVAHLEAVNAIAPLHMWSIQQGLWSHYQALPDSGTGSIAAMPSIHVAAVVLFAVAAARVHWAIGSVMWLYAFLTLVGSVYLGWHYAIDGYVAGIGAVLLWFAAGRFTEWYWPRMVQPFDGSERPGPERVGIGSRPV